MSSPEWTPINKPTWTAINKVPTTGPVNNSTVMKKQLESECELILADGPDELFRDKLLKVAGVFTNHEIVEKANVKPSKKPLNMKSINQRITYALNDVAGRDGKPRETVKAELVATRKANGVDKRTNAYKVQRRMELKAKNPAGGEAPSVPGPNVAADEDDPDEDPLGDLEEMGRRELEDSLDEGESPEEMQPKSKKPVKPFDATFTGYMAHDPELFIPGFRVFE